MVMDDLMVLERWCAEYMKIFYNLYTGETTTDVEEAWRNVPGTNYEFKGHLRNVVDDTNSEDSRSESDKNEQKEDDGYGALPLMSQNKLGDRDDLSIVSFDEICVDRAKDLDKDTVHQVTSTAFTFTDLIRLLLQSRFVGVMKGFILSSGIVALIQYLWPSSVVCFDDISNIIRSFKYLSDITKLYTYFIEHVIPAIS